MDEDNAPAPAENVDAVEDNSVDAPPAPEANTSEPTEVEEAPEVSETTVEPERKPTRAERRIRQLAEEVKQLRNQPNPLEAPPQQPPVAVQPPDPGQEYDSYDQYADKYRQDVVQAANAIAGLQTQQQIQQLEARMNLERDVEVVPKEFPELDEKSLEYNPVLAAKVEEAYKQQAIRNNQLDPNVRLSAIAKDYVDVARAAAVKSSADTNRAVAQQADTSAVRPSGQVRADKSAEDMSIEELEAKLGYAQR